MDKKEKTIEVLKLTKGNATKAAAMLKISRQTLYRNLKAREIEKIRDDDDLFRLLLFAGGDIAEVACRMNVTKRTVYNFCKKNLIDLSILKKKKAERRREMAEIVVSGLNGNKSRAAKEMGVTRRSLYKLLKVRG